MSNKTFLTALLAALATTPAMAQGLQLKAASIDASIDSAIEDDVDAYQSTLKGTAEFAITPNILVGASLGLFSHGGDLYETSDADSTNMTLHAMYMYTPTTGIGVFAATEAYDGLDDNINTVGFEFGMRNGNIALDGYYGLTDLEAYNGDDFTFGGLSASYITEQGFAFALNYDAFTPIEGVTDGGEYLDGKKNDLSVSAGYALENGVNLSASLGRLSSSATGDDGTRYYNEDPVGYVGFNVGYNFGAAGGTLTDVRSFGDLGSF
ncbi:hypothetical protein [Yoonia sp. I 8.24]|uniref:hypothetical protein n=1 Tax=Yoonia sp. I 8.24 TaxID=1537229 RepID=UPI001EDDB316|nr:hypothetical protein [Yoonia sp. I 8.24]MCG3267742.1 hypothetical protein [Yoonia sp. I 8.24]